MLTHNELKEYVNLQNKLTHEALNDAPISTILEINTAIIDLQLKTKLITLREYRKLTNKPAIRTLEPNYYGKIVSVVSDDYIVTINGGKKYVCDGSTVVEVIS